MNPDFELYPGKSLPDLFEEIVRRSESKKDQIDTLLGDIRPLIKSANDAVMFLPHIQELLTIGIKNDEQLVKLSAVAQRIQSAKTDGLSEGLLTDKEKEDLINSSITEIKSISQDMSSTNVTSSLLEVVKK